MRSHLKLIPFVLGNSQKEMSHSLFCGGLDFQVFRKSHLHTPYIPCSHLERPREAKYTGVWDSLTHEIAQVYSASTFLEKGKAMERVSWKNIDY